MRRMGWPGLALGTLVVLGAGSAHADMSACESAPYAKDYREQVNLWTLCIEKGGGIDAGNLGGALSNRGVAYVRLGEFDKAMADFNASISYIPRWGFGYYNRASLYARRGEWTKAEADLDIAAKLDPARIRPSVFQLRAQARTVRGDFKGAVADDEEALSYDRNFEPALNQEAWLLATAPDASVRNGSKAVQLALKAVKNKDSDAVHDTLAAAYAEAGDFAGAQREQQRAIELLAPGATQALRDEYKARLEGYAKGQPYRTPAPAPRAP